MVMPGLVLESLGQDGLSLLTPYPAAEVMAPATNAAPLLVGPIVDGGEVLDQQQMLGGVPWVSDGIQIPPPEVAQGELGWLPGWANPMSWFVPALWERSFELGISGSDGNANAMSLRTGLDLSRETERTNWDIDLTYRKADASGVETQHNALLYSDLDYKLANPGWSWFNKFGLEYDEFKEFDVRLNYNTGFGYLLIDTPVSQFRSRFGAGTSREIGSNDDAWKPEAVFGFDFSRQFSANQKFSMVFDYYPNWTDFNDYRIVTDAGWEFLLSEANNLSLKIGVIDRYDSTPGTARPNDIDYSVLLIWAR